VAISIDWASRVITVPQADLTLVSAGLYELDVETFRLALRDIEDGEDGMAFPDTHRRNAPVTLAGATYAQTFEIINGYTVTFEATGSPWTARIVGANHNIGDVKNVNHVSLIIGNSAGLIVVDSSGAGLPTVGEIAAAVRAELAGELLDVVEIHKIHGLKAGSPLAVSQSQRTAGGIAQTIERGGDTTTVTRQ
jgi:hypothetical protein